MEPTIALVFSPELWVERLHHHLTDHGGARVRQIVLEPALALRSYVADVKRFVRGASAGYGRSWRAPEDTWRRETADPFPGNR